MRKNPFLVLPLVVLIIFTFSLLANPLTYALAQQANAVENGDAEEKTQNTSEKLFDILDKAKNHIETVFENLAGQNVTVPVAAKQRYESGIAHAEDATQALNENRTKDGEDAIIAAMTDFKEALSQLGNANVTASTPVTTGISQAIDRSSLFIEKLNAIVEEAKSMGYPTEDIEERIQQSRTMLINTTSLLEEGKTDEATKMLGDARRSISGLSGELNVITKAEKSRKIKEFADMATERINEIEQKAEELLPDQASDNVKASIERAKEHISNSTNLANDKQLESSVDELEKVVKEAKQGEEEMARESPAITQKLRADITANTGTIESLQHRIDALGDDVDSEGIRQNLADAKNLLQKATEELNSGDLQAANKTLKDLGKIIEMIQDAITENADGGAMNRGEEHSKNQK